MNWYSANKRNLPWRTANNPYTIWLSEIILQQTRVNQGIPYYYKFLGAFPDIHSLAMAGEKSVLKLWQGLGYYSRARNLHATAKIIDKKYKGRFPDTYTEILKLKGVGEYTAAAISSFAFGEARAVVDGNVFRLLSRFFGIHTSVNTTKGKKEFYELANSLIDKKRPGLFNQAMMEFGALQCKPIHPNCGSCCLQTACYAFLKKQVEGLPVKNKKKKVRIRHFNYLVLRQGNSIYLRKRTGKDIWKNLYDFPLIETEKKYPEGKLIGHSEWKEHAGNGAQIMCVSKTYKHVLSHQIIHAKFWQIQLKRKSSLKTKNLKKIKIVDFDLYAVPRLIEKYAETHLLSGY